MSSLEHFMPLRVLALHPLCVVPILVEIFKVLNMIHSRIFWSLSCRENAMDGDECRHRHTIITIPDATRRWLHDCPECRYCNLISICDKIWKRCLRQLFSFPNRWFSWVAHLRSWVRCERPWSWVGWPQSPMRKTTDVKSATRPRRDYIPHNNSSLALQIDDFGNFENGTLTALYFFITCDGVWKWAGFDPALRNWRLLRPLTYLPPCCKPNLDLFKEYQVCTKNGIVCMNVSKSTEGKFIVFNVSTGAWKALPQLSHPRNPVLMHLVVDALGQTYQVIVAGSSRSGDDRLSRVTEVFDSHTGKWKTTGDLPGPEFALNDYQSGVCKDGNLYCIAFLDQGGRGILQYNVTKGIWMKNWAYPIPFSSISTLLQLVESRGELYLFSEQDIEHKVEHCIDKLDLNVDCTGGVSWSLKSVVRAKKMGGRSLEVYPEHVCVPYSDHQLCVFNTLDHSGVVYDVQNCGESEVLLAPPAEGFHGEILFSLNAMSFTIEPSSKSGI